MLIGFGCTELGEVPCEFLPYVVRPFGEPASFELQGRQRMVQQPLVAHEPVEVAAHVHAEVQLVDPRRVQLVEETVMIRDGTRFGYRRQESTRQGCARWQLDELSDNEQAENESNDDRSEKTEKKNEQFKSCTRLFGNQRECQRC